MSLNFRPIPTKVATLMPLGPKVLAQKEGDLRAKRRGFFPRLKKRRNEMSRQFRGKTEDADSIFLGAKFWKPGLKIAGKVIRTFDSENGPCYVLGLLDAVKVNGELFEQVSIGNLTGFRMALQAAGLDGLQVNDAVHLECTGLESTTKGSPRLNFSIEVTRP